MERDVFRKLEEKIDEIERRYGSLENFILLTTNLDEEHTLRMEEDYSSTFQELEKVYQEFKELDLVDLLDYRRFVGEEYGEFD